jgi:RNA polymerase sigma factor (sigma-70 family)
LFGKEKTWHRLDIPRHYDVPTIGRPIIIAEGAMPEVLARSLALLTRRLSTKHDADGALLARYTSANDPAAFAELVRRHGPMVLGVCRRMLGQWHDADDAFQATFLVLARSARSVRKPGALPSWLYGTAVRVCRKVRGRRRPAEPVPDRAAADDPFAEVAWKEVRGLLDEEVGRLPDSLRAPLLLCYFDGLSRDEAAARLGWSRRTLMRRLEKARERLRLRLERRGVAALGVGAAVLAPRGLAAVVPDALIAAAVSLGTGGPVSAAVRVLAAGTGGNLLHVALGLSLLVVGAGLGLAAFSAPSSTEPPAAPAANDREVTPREKSAALDGDGSPLPAGAVHRLGSRRFRVEGRSDFILPTPDGKHVLVHPWPSLSAYAAQGLMLLDADTGLRVRSFEDGRRVPKSQGYYEAIRPAAFSPDGKKLYALGWHKSEKDGNGFAQWASFDNPCRRVLLAWDVATGRLTHEWDLPPGNDHGASLLGVTASPDGKRLYVSGAVRMTVAPDRHIHGEPGLHVLDAATGKLLQTWDGAGYPAAFAADGKEVITFRKGAAITAYDAETGKPVRTFPLDGWVSGVVLGPDGKALAAVAVTGLDSPTGCEIKLWEAATAREIRRLTADAKIMRSAPARLAFAADGKTLYLGTGSGRILRWNLSDGTALPDWPAHQGAVADLWLRPHKGELISAGAWDGALARWDAASGKCLSARGAYVGEIAVARAPGGQEVAAVDAAGRLDVWDVATGRVKKTLQAPGRGRHQLLFTPDGRQLLVAAESGPSTVWDLSAGRQVGELAPPPAKDPKATDSYWGTLGFSPDGRQLVAARFGRGTWAWSWPERALLWHEAKEEEACCFADGATLVCGDWHGDIEMRDPRTGAVRRTLPVPGIAHVAYSPDRRRMVTAHLDGVLRVRDGATGEVQKELKGFRYAWCVAFSPTGWLLAASGDNSVRVYDTASWQEVARLDGHEGTVRAVFFGPDDATLVSASAEDGTALVWSLKPPAGREAPDVARLWADLADSAAARRAVWAAVQHPDVAIKLFREKWPVPERPADAERIRKLIAQLDADAFADREAAEAELKKIGRPAEEELRKALTDATSPEVKRRVKAVVERWSPPTTAEYPAEEARELRAVWALELAGTPEAKKLLEGWAVGKVGNRLCEEAAAALKRWRR